MGSSDLQSSTVMRLVESHKFTAPPTKCAIVTSRTHASCTFSIVTANHECASSLGLLESNSDSHRRFSTPTSLTRPGQEYETTFPLPIEESSAVVIVASKVISSRSTLVMV